MTIPRRDSASTPNVLTGMAVAAGVTVALASRVTVGLVTVSVTGVQADAANRKQKAESRRRKAEDDLAKKHHWDGRKYQHKEEDRERADRAATRIEFGDLVERLRVDASQPEEKDRPKPPGAPHKT